jgi:hypothetical protein
MELMVVMPALVAGIHVWNLWKNNHVDGRNKSGHDGVRFWLTHHALKRLIPTAGGAEGRYGPRFSRDHAEQGDEIWPDAAPNAPRSGGDAFFLPSEALPDIRCGRFHPPATICRYARTTPWEARNRWFAAIAQLVEHVIRNDGVGGSSPSCGTSQ